MTYNLINATNGNVETDRQRNSSAGSPSKNSPSKKNMHINRSDVVNYKNQVMSTNSISDLSLHPVVIDSHKEHNFNYNPNSIVSLPAILNTSS